jgi:hypothetical protein
MLKGFGLILDTLGSPGRGWLDNVADRGAERQRHAHFTALLRCGDCGYLA